MMILSNVICLLSIAMLVSHSNADGDVSVTKSDHRSPGLDLLFKYI